jgi:hypothetical protein
MKKTTAITALMTIFCFTVCTMTMCTKDPCKSVKCQNGGTCSKGSCSCPSGYEGTLCENRINAKFVGGYSGKDCAGDNTTIIITAGSSPNEITFNDGTISPSMHGTVNGTTMTFPTQTVTDNVTGDQLTVSGTGSLNGNSISLTISVKDNSTLETGTCTINANK